MRQRLPAERATQQPTIISSRNLGDGIPQLLESLTPGARILKESSGIGLERASRSLVLLKEPARTRGRIENGARTRCVNDWEG